MKGLHRYLYCKKWFLDESSFLKVFDEAGKGKFTGTFMLYNFQYIVQVESDTCILVSTVKFKSYPSFPPPPKKKGELIWLFVTLVFRSANCFQVHYKTILLMRTKLDLSTN